MIILPLDEVSDLSQQTYPSCGILAAQRIQEREVLLREPDRKSLDMSEMVHTCQKSVSCKWMMSR